MTLAELEIAYIRRVLKKLMEISASRQISHLLTEVRFIGSWEMKFNFKLQFDHPDLITNLIGLLCCRPA
jgi:hypothetical protein